MTVAQSGSLVMPTGPGALQDFQTASHYNNNGTVSVKVVNPDGSSIGSGGGGGGGTQYEEGTTVVTATGNAIIYRGVGGTTTAVGTANGLPVSQVTTQLYTASAFQARLGTADATGTSLVKAGTGATQIYIKKIILSVGTAMAVTFLDNTAAMIGPLMFPNKGIFSVSMDDVAGTVSVGGTLNVASDTAGSLSVFITGNQQ